mmetsp:Transcript_23240/g.31791  ORF Transcript_23240/g.31791 Transcript_23240/m.31791 type:complete len:147 (+) Transcript_23240:1136-1576(+)
MQQMPLRGNDQTRSSLIRPAKTLHFPETMIARLLNAAGMVSEVLTEVVQDKKTQLRAAVGHNVQPVILQGALSPTAWVVEMSAPLLLVAAALQDILLARGRLQGILKKRRLKIPSEMRVLEWVRTSTCCRPSVHIRTRKNSIRSLC